MLCAVDIGNTNIVIALMESSEKICFSKRIITDRNLTKEKFKQEVKTAFENRRYDLSSIEGVIISSVVPEITQNVTEGMRELTASKVMVLGQELCTGLIVNMDNPDKVGSDLIADAIAAAEEYTGMVAIFDMGTATTCSVVKNKEYLGTIIMPGVIVSQNALSEKASQLPRIQWEMTGDFNVRLMGKNTAESMIGGMVYGNAAMIDGIADRIEDEMGENISVVATGGIAQLIVPYCKREIVLEKNLLLKGLWYAFKRNESRRH